VTHFLEVICSLTLWHCSAMSYGSLPTSPGAGAPCGVAAHSGSGIFPSTTATAKSAAGTGSSKRSCRASPPLPSNGRGNGQAEREAPSPDWDERELRVARELLRRGKLSAKERVALFIEETGKSREAFCRRQRELRETEEMDGLAPKEARMVFEADG